MRHQVSDWLAVGNYITYDAAGLLTLPHGAGSGIKLVPKINVSCVST